ncbi:MAG: hypothetical protein LUG24_07395 [Clostridiales bacterium]|nr:hypothetical protein [Clostridiales bacterium]
MDSKTFDFKAMDQVPLYSRETGFGFVSETAALPSRKLNTDDIFCGIDGFFINENGTGGHIFEVSPFHYSFGGLVFRTDNVKPGAYKIKVGVTGCSRENVNISVNGMNPNRITDSGFWDAARKVRVKNHALWTDAATFEYDFVSAEGYIEAEAEPKKLPTEKAPCTVGLSYIEITELEENKKEIGKIPTIYVLGDFTEKTYTFEEAPMSGWGQLIHNMFDSERVNIVNFSAGGRSMRAMYNENRFNDLLLTAKEGDFVFLHSAHNDERNDGIEGPEARFGRGTTAEGYCRWLNNVFIPSMRTRGLKPVLVTAMPRTDGGIPRKGFNPDSVGFMKKAASENADVECINLFEGAREYLLEIGADAVKAVFMGIEAGETPGKTNSGSYANGHPDNRIDGTHFKEAASKVWCRLIAEQIYRQGQEEAASKNMKDLASYLKEDIKEAARTENWDKIYPEQAEDVSFKPTKEGGYYRNQIEKLLQLGVMFKDEAGKFRPEEYIVKNEFIAALCALWGLDTCEEDIKAALKPHFSRGCMRREEMAAVIFEAYRLRFGCDKKGRLNRPPYMTDYNGSNVSPDDPNYDPNLTGEETGYYPIVKWEEILDKDEILPEYFKAFHTVYDLGLMRSERDIERGKLINGRLLEPKKTVTRAKATKELWFLWVLGHDVLEDGSSLTVTDREGNKREVVYKPI